MVNSMLKVVTGLEDLFFCFVNLRRKNLLLLIISKIFKFREEQKKNKSHSKYITTQATKQSSISTLKGNKCLKHFKQILKEKMYKSLLIFQSVKTKFTVTKKKVKFSKQVKI